MRSVDDMASGVETVTNGSVVDSLANDTVEALVVGILGVATISVVEDVVLVVVENGTVLTGSSVVFTDPLELVWIWITFGTFVV